MNESLHSFHIVLVVAPVALQGEGVIFLPEPTRAAVQPGLARVDVHPGHVLTLARPGTFVQVLSIILAT